MKNYMFVYSYMQKSEEVMRTCHDKCSHHFDAVYETYVSCSADQIV